jgi:hypothetical protein
MSLHFRKPVGLMNFPHLFKLVQIFLPQLNLRNFLVIVHDLFDLMLRLLQLGDLLLTEVPNGQGKQVVIIFWVDLVVLVGVLNLFGRFSFGQLRERLKLVLDKTLDPWLLLIHKLELTIYDLLDEAYLRSEDITFTLEPWYKVVFSLFISLDSLFIKDIDNLLNRSEFTQLLTCVKQNHIVLLKIGW